MVIVFLAKDSEIFDVVGATGPFGFDMIYVKIPPTSTDLFCSVIFVLAALISLENLFLYCHGGRAIASKFRLEQYGFEVI